MVSGDIGVRRSDTDILRAVAIAIGLVWAASFAVVALLFELEFYADGSMFSYAVAVQDVWAFHWHNISDRLSVFILSLWPAELFVGLTGKPYGGIVVYGLLFYLAPLAGLIGTFAADRSRGRVIFTYACASTALLCPLVFGFPTEMWMAHALFWPTLAIAHYAVRNISGALLLLAAMLALILSHEGAIVLAGAIVAAQMMRGVRDAAFLRTGGALCVSLAAWLTIRLTLPPDDYFAGVWLRAALHFFDPDIFDVSVVLLLLASLAAYAVLFFVLARWNSPKAHLYSAALVALALVIYWLTIDHAVHASSRYYLRTALVILTPLLGGLASFYASRADGLLRANAGIARIMTALTSERAARATVGALTVVTLVHAVETAKFVTAWTHYKTAVASLATGSVSDPALGDPRFVSSARIVPDLNRLSWFSTTPYLSVLVANLMPKRLVIDPKGNYFWLSCATATANADAPRAVPAEARELIRIYSCLHR